MNTAIAPSYRRLAGSNHDFRRVFAGQVISRVGDAVDEVAVIWLVLQLTGSALATATALVFQILPTVLFGLVAGALVDRWNRRRTMIAMDAVRAAIVLLIPILKAAGALSLPLLYALVFALAVASQVFRPALRASLANLVKTEDLVGANSLLETTRQLAGILGPAVGGVLIATVGISAVFILDALSFLVSGVLIARARIPQASGNPAHGTSGLFRDIVEGIRYLVGARTVFILALLGILSHFYWAAIPLVAPVFAAKVVGAGSVGYGALLSGLNLGMAASGLAIGLLPPIPRGRLILTGYFGMGITAALLAVTKTLWQGVAVLTVSGAVSMLTVVPFFALLQEQVPDEFRGRVFATDETLEHAVLPPFFGIVGWLLDVRGARFVLILVGMVLVGLGILGASRREVREAT